MGSRRYASGEDIITQGEAGDAIYFVEHGSVQAEIDAVVVRSYRLGGYFGELALLTDQPRKATVRAGSAGAQIVKLNRQAFEDSLVSKFRELILVNMQYKIMTKLNIKQIGGYRPKNRGQKEKIYYGF